jgi:hypothetical protein
MNMVNGASQKSGGQYDYDFRFLRQVAIFPDVCFGSEAAARPNQRRGCFTPESCRGRRRPARLLWTKSGLVQCNKVGFGP